MCISIAFEKSWERVLRSLNYADVTFLRKKKKKKENEKNKTKKKRTHTHTPTPHARNKTKQNKQEAAFTSFNFGFRQTLKSDTVEQS